MPRNIFTGIRTFRVEVDIDQAIQELIDYWGLQYLPRERCPTDKVHGCGPLSEALRLAIMTSYYIYVEGLDPDSALLAAMKRLRSRIYNKRSGRKLLNAVRSLKRFALLAEMGEVDSSRNSFDIIREAEQLRRELEKLLEVGAIKID